MCIVKVKDSDHFRIDSNLINLHIGKEMYTLHEWDFQILSYMYMYDKINSYKNHPTEKIVHSYSVTSQE